LFHIGLGLGEIKITFEGHAIVRLPTIKYIILCKCGSEGYEISDEHPHESHCRRTWNIKPRSH